MDGGIIGTPPVAAGFIRLYLSGSQAGEVRDLFDGSPVDARVIDHEARSGAGASGAGAVGGIGVVGSASAVKMAYASWTKGSAALLLAARALARAEGVEETLLAEWGISQPGLDERSARAAGSAAAKGWRWIAEMEEIAATMAAARWPRASTRPRPRFTAASGQPSAPGRRLIVGAPARSTPDRLKKVFLIRTSPVLALVQQEPRRSVR